MLTCIILFPLASVDNDFHQQQAIFDLFKGLNVKNMSEPIEMDKMLETLSVNGNEKPLLTNGVDSEARKVSAAA